MTDEIEVPFPSDPECLVEMYPSGRGWITFIDPKHNVRTSLPVTLGPHLNTAFNPIWHVDLEDGHLVTSPSIHVPGDWHSPNPTRWRIVEALADET